MTELQLLAFAKAWSDKNPREVMRFFTEDCLYRPSIGDGSKKQFMGKPEVERAVIRMLEFDETAFAEVHNIRIDGEFGFWEWRYKRWDGTEILGCDVFQFRGDKIVVKNAFRKIENIKDEKSTRSK